MILYIDADGCPVVDIAVKTAAKHGVEVFIVADTAHFFESDIARVLIVSKGSDSADFAIVSRCVRGDVVVTQDYALAAMCLAKGAYAMNQNGLYYTDENIDGMLMRRHIKRKIRMSGVRMSHMKKREKGLDEKFEKALEQDKRMSK